ncbi:hypothetical protein QYE76_023646 [Lolium multiflorum]|uniref:DUF3615 domain-containing protein n=1 Tax=Lolium multiflorum TaxID=4521 RepID=A0AAD8RDN3_LOLMU|nr:hypothetical protein QYE76_023646 [Lolium multiflorum]
MPEQAVQDLHREDQILQERAMCGCGMQSTHQRTEEERDASIICHVHHALRHYNAKDEGSDFVPVKPLMAAYVGFRGHIWVHISFLACRGKITSSKRRRSKDDHVKHFFAELRYDHHFSTPTVETCTIIEKSSRKSHLNTMCTFCPKSFEILHPLDGKFLCGKKSQADEEQSFSHFMNLLEKPYTCVTASGEVKEDVAIPEEERRSILRWTILPFNFIRGFCGPWMLNLRRG